MLEVRKGEKSIFANIVLMADSSGVKQCWREQCNKMFYELWVQLWYCTFIEHWLKCVCHLNMILCLL